MKAWLASLTERQRTWLAIGVLPLLPVLIPAFIVVFIPYGLGCLMFCGVYDAIDGACRWARGEPARKRPSRMGPP